MLLPDYFMADLPPGTLISPDIITEACLTLRRNRERFLAHKTTEQVITIVSNAASDWLDANNLFRKQALEEASKLGLTKELLADGIDAFFSQVTEKNLRALILQDLGHFDRLEKFCSTEIELAHDRAAFARAPELLVHANSVNNAWELILNLIFGLLLRSAQFCVSFPGHSGLLRLFAHSIYQMEPKIGACIEIAEWNNIEINKILIDQADLVTVPENKVSFAYIAREALHGSKPIELARSAALDIAAWDQHYSHAPHVIYVEHGGSLEIARFAELVSEALKLMEESHPSGPIATAAAEDIAARRKFYETRAGSSERTKIWSSPSIPGWTVIFEADPLFQNSCLNRFIFVKTVTGSTEAIHAAESVRNKVSTIALEAGPERKKILATEFAKWGVDRICRLGNMHQPPLYFRRNGAPSLASLIRWVDWELS